MPAGIKDAKLWNEAIAKVGDKDWAGVLKAYKGMGGEADSEAEEACTSGQMGQLMRAGESWQDEAQRFVSVHEAEVNSSKRQVRSILITEGPGNQRDKNYYTEEFIRDAAKKYEGARAYLNHASESEYKNRPEGDVRELCGFYRDLKVVSVRDKQTGETVAAVEGTLCLDESTAGKNALAKVEAQLMYDSIFPESPEEYCGLSISGSGVREGQADIKGQKWNRIVGVGQADSVDVVTRPARGGAFLALTESAGKATHLPKETVTMIKKLMAITAEITEATKSMSESKTDAERAVLKVKLEGLNKKLKEASEEPVLDDAAKAKAEEEAAAKAKAEADATHPDADKDMAMLKDLIPQMADEAEEAYSERMAKVKAAFAPKDDTAPKATESMSVDKFRKENPRMFEAVAARVRESAAEKGEDIKAVKAELREAKTELQVIRDKDMASKLLSEAGVPSKFLSIGDLIGMDESQMKRQIERTKAIIEAASGRVVVPANVQGGKSVTGLSESIKTVKAQAGV